MIEVPIALKPLVEILCLVLEKRKVLRFRYYSESSGEIDREVRPYMVIPNQKGNLELVGIPIEELSNPVDSRKKGHYLLIQLLERIEKEQFEILEETFNEPGAPRNIVDNTQSKVVCRYIYDDENKKEVKKQWLKVKYIK